MINQKMRDSLRKHDLQLESDKPIGFGAQAKAYDAKTLRHSFPCVVKIYEHVDDLQHKRLIDEINTLKTLCDSDYVVRLYDLFEVDDSVVLVLEKCGRSFAQLLIEHQRTHPNAGLPRTEVYRLFEPVARALAHCRDSKVIHGDVNPKNIVQTLRRDGAKLIDFGTARLDLSATTLTSHGGTAAYMLPRHENTEGDGLTRERDLFGLAVSYAELRLGRHPYQNSDPGTGKFELTVLDVDEIQFLHPILAGGPIPDVDPKRWFRTLDPLRVQSVVTVEAYLDRAALLVERVDARRWSNGYRPDQRDIDDVRDAKKLLDTREKSEAKSHEYHGLRSRVLATLADLVSAAGQTTEAKRLFSEAMQAINQAIELGPEIAAYWANRADLRLIAHYNGTRDLPLMFVLGDRCFDAPNSPWSSDVKSWPAKGIAKSLNDLTRARRIDPTPAILARRALLLSLRAILLFVGERFDGTDKITQSYPLPATFFPKFGGPPKEITYRLAFPSQMAFDETVQELTHAIDACLCPATRASLYLQRAWAKAGFGFAIGDEFSSSEAFVSETDDGTIVVEHSPGILKLHWSLAEAILDLENAERAIRDAGLPMPSAIKRKRLSYSLWNAFDLDIQMADLLGLLDQDFFDPFWEEDLWWQGKPKSILDLIQIYAGFKWGVDTSPWWGMSKECFDELRTYLENHTKAYKRSPLTLNKFFKSGPWRVAKTIQRL